MKNDLLYLLSRGPKSEVELAAFFGFENLAQVMSTIEELQMSGCINVSSRQGEVAGSGTSRASEYRLLVNTISAA